MTYNSQKNAYIQIKTNPEGSEFIYYNIPGYYMRFNFLFKSLGSTPYYSDADYYLGNNIFINRSNYKPQYNAYMNPSLNNLFARAHDTFIYDADQTAYMKNPDNRLQYKSSQFIRQSAIRQGALSPVLAAIPGTIQDRGQQILNIINSSPDPESPYWQSLLINQASIFATGKVIKVQRDLGVFKMQWDQKSVGPLTFKIPIGVSRQSYKSIEDSYIEHYTKSGIKNTIMPNAQLPDTYNYPGFSSSNAVQSNYVDYQNTFVLKMDKAASTIKLWQYTGSAATISPIYNQIASNKEDVHALEQWNQTGKRSNISGNLIKFWIEDVNNKRVMSTPAFIQDLSDQGGNGQWQAHQYIGAVYPQFSYKSVQPRKISFNLKITSFSKDDWKFYINKLNFLRGVGFPKNQNGKLIKYYRPGQNSAQPLNPVYHDTMFQFPQAPIYKMTLGDIISEQYGYFEVMDISWPDDQAVWNFNPKINKTLDDAEDINFMEIPKMTAFRISFVCMYGRAPSNMHKFYMPSAQTGSREIL